MGYLLADGVDADMVEVFDAMSQRLPIFPSETSEDMLAIELSAVEKQWRTSLFGAPRRVLRGVDLRVERGSGLLLLGPNGAGKSTLLWMLAGLRRPSRGTVRLLGRSPSDPRTRARLGMLPESPALPVGTVLEVLHRAALAHGLPRRGSTARLNHLLRRLELWDRADRSTRTLSTGVRQRVALARALLHEPDVLLLDEPLANIDPAMVPCVVDVIAEERRRGTTVLVATHRPADWAPACPRAVRLVDGRLQDLGSTATWLAGRPTRIHSVAPDGGWTVQETAADERESTVEALRAGGHRVVRIDPDLREDRCS